MFFTFLHITSNSGHAEILAYLIAKGGDVMENHNFPLCRAATRGGCVATLTKSEIRKPIRREVEACMSLSPVPSGKLPSPS